MKAWHLRPNYMDLSFITPIWTPETARFLFKLSELKKAEEKEPYEGREIDEREVHILTDAELKEERRKVFIFAYKKGVTDYYRKDSGLEELANKEFLVYERSLEGEK